MGSLITCGLGVQTASSGETIVVEVPVIVEKSVPIPVIVPIVPAIPYVAVRPEKPKLYQREAIYQRQGLYLSSKASSVKNLYVRIPQQRSLYTGGYRR